jgi:hypothetical protein
MGAATPGRERAATGSRVGAALTRPTLELEPKTTRVSDFEEWWALYPRKADKTRARVKYLTARKTLPPEIGKGALLLAVKNYAAEIERSKTEDRFVKHAATFLNGTWEEWVDRALPVEEESSDLPIPSSRFATRPSATDPTDLA